LGFVCGAAAHETHERQESKMASMDFMQARLLLASHSFAGLPFAGAFGV
jgi:hypothetical protein